MGKNENDNNVTDNIVVTDMENNGTEDDKTVIQKNKRRRHFIFFIVISFIAIIIATKIYYDNCVLEYEQEELIPEPLHMHMHDYEPCPMPIPTPLPDYSDLQEKEKSNNKSEDKNHDFLVDLTGDSPSRIARNLQKKLEPAQRFTIHFNESNGLHKDISIYYGESLGDRYYEPYNEFGKFDGWYFEDGTKLEKDTKLWTGYDCTVKARWIWNPDYKSITVTLGAIIPIHAMPNGNIGHALFNPIDTEYHNLVVSIVDIKSGPGSDLGWGLLLAYKEKRNGWVSLDKVRSINSINLKKDNRMIIYNDEGLKKWCFRFNWKTEIEYYTIHLDEAKSGLNNKDVVVFGSYLKNIYLGNMEYKPKHPYCVFDGWYFSDGRKLVHTTIDCDCIVRARWIWNPMLESITGWINDIVPIHAEPNINVEHAPNTPSDTGKKNLKVVIVDIQQGPGSNLGWGLLEAYKEKRNGWISLDYLKDQCEQENKQAETENNAQSSETEQENKQVETENNAQSSETEQENKQAETENNAQSSETEQENKQAETENNAQNKETEQENKQEETENNAQNKETEQENKQEETENNAQSSEKKYKIHFDASKGGVDDKDILVASGQTISDAYYEPSHLFCKFDGWYLNNGTKLNRDSKIECNCTAKARWIWNPEYDCITVTIEKRVPIHAKPDINVGASNSSRSYTDYSNIIVSIYDIKQGPGSNLGWGLLLTYKDTRNGWINMDDVTVLWTIRKKDHSWIKFGEKGLKITSPKN